MKFIFENITASIWNAFIDEHYNSINHWDYAYIADIDNVNIDDAFSREEEKELQQKYKYFLLSTNDEYLFFTSESDALQAAKKCWPDLVSAINNFMTLRSCKGGKNMKKTTSIRDLYQRYVKKWKEDHATFEFEGMEPACFEEWKDNEFQEMLEAALCFETAEELFNYSFENETDLMIEFLKYLVEEQKTYRDFFEGNENVLYYHNKYYWGFFI